jgi:uncharacterized RDD family membrane protein YckC
MAPHQVLALSLLYCVQCGKQIPDDALVCPYCAARVPGKAAEEKATKPATTPFSFPSKSGLDALTKDQRVQQYWGRRLLAFVIDAIVLSVAAGILASIVMLPMFFTYGFGYQFNSPYSWVGFGPFPLLWGIISVLYFAFTEFHYGHTLGKSLMGFKVTTDDGQALTMEKALIRNISKIHWGLLFLDLIFGLATETDYRKKYGDRYARTIVVPK